MSMVFFKIVAISCLLTLPLFSKDYFCFDGETSKAAEKRAIAEIRLETDADTCGICKIPNCFQGLICNSLRKHILREHGNHSSPLECLICQEHVGLAGYFLIALSE